MEALVVGVLTSLTAGAGLTLWYLLVHPSLLLSVLDDDVPLTGDRFFREHPVAVTALQWSFAALFLGLTFLTGAATAFLAKTTY